MAKPIEVPIPNSPRERQARLQDLQDTKMSESAHGFVRASLPLFYRTLEERPGHSFPLGPPVWICGDCHVENVGAVADAAGVTELSLNDLDEAVVGSPTHDLLRMALSVSMELRAGGLTGPDLSRLVHALAKGYATVIEQRSRDLAFDLGEVPPRFKKLLKRAARQTPEKLMRHFELEKVPSGRTFPVGDRYWPLTRTEDRAVRKLVGSEEVQTLITTLSGRGRGEPTEIVDTTFRVAGTASLGVFRAAALVHVGGEKPGKRKDESLAKVDMKEAAPSVTPRHPGGKTPEDDAERVIAAARQMAPHFGERMMAAELLGRRVVVRELWPEEKKARLTALEAGEVEGIGAFLGGLVARAHARQLTSHEAADWLAELKGGKQKRGVAPDWLWHTLVDLIGVHETAYLLHCRKVAERKRGLGRKSRRA